MEAKSFRIEVARFVIQATALCTPFPTFRMEGSASEVWPNLLTVRQMPRKLIGPSSRRLGRPSPELGRNLTSWHLRTFLHATPSASPER